MWRYLLHRESHVNSAKFLRSLLNLRAWKPRQQSPLGLSATSLHSGPGRYPTSFFHWHQNLKIRSSRVFLTQGKLRKYYFPAVRNWPKRHRFDSIVKIFSGNTDRFFDKARVLDFLNYPGKPNGKAEMGKWIFRYTFDWVTSLHTGLLPVAIA